MEKLKTTSTSSCITDLPDCIITNILSRLLTKEATRTSVLSRDWKHKWTSIYRVDIDIGSNNVASFDSFVDNVLHSTNPDLRLRLFSLVLRKCKINPYDLERWISQVLGRSVDELQIVGPRNRCEIVLERSTSLTVLALYLTCTLIIRTDNCFPSLKRLYLRGRSGIRTMDEQSANVGRGLSLSFPVLEHVELFEYEFGDVEFVTINAPKLTSFKAASTSDENKYVIKILAPDLSRFQSKSRVDNSFVLNAPSLYSAVLLMDCDLPSKFLASAASPLLHGAPNLKCLTLSCAIMKALAKWKGVHGFPTFNRLIQLRLYGSNNKGLMELLHATPYLESPTLSARCYIHKVIREPLPCCIVSQLKQVHLHKFIGKRSQFDVANLFLENAKKLESLYLYSPSVGGTKEGDINSWVSGLGPERSNRVKVVLRA